jgi:hypothetical protein
MQKCKLEAVCSDGVEAMAFTPFFA